MLATVYRGADGVDRVAFHEETAEDSEFGDHPLFSDSMADAATARHPAFTAAAERIDAYAADVLKRFNLPGRHGGLIWDDAAGRLHWCHHGAAGDQAPPEYVQSNRSVFEFTELAGEVAAKFVAQNPGGDEAVYASQWLKVRDAVIYADAAYDFRGRTAKIWEHDHDQTDAHEALNDGFFAGLAVGERLGAILYEWRLCVLYGTDLRSWLEERATQQAAQEASAKKRTKWKPKAFELAEAHCAKYPGKSQGEVADKIRPKLKAYRDQVLAGPKVNGEKPYYPLVPSRERLIRAIREFETDGLLIDGVKKYLTR